MKLVLVYQAGIANVFEVAAFATDHGPQRKAKRVLQSDFRACENFARGAKYAGAEVTTMGCNQAGDITTAQWTVALDSLPFGDQFHAVLS